MNGNYALVLDFDSPQVPLDVWEQKQQKMTAFFGPGVDVKIAQPEEERIELTLVTNSETEKS